VSGAVALIVSLAFSFLKPNCVRMKPGDLLRMTARCSDQAASSAVIGFPEANLRPFLILNV
jgi:hypothetical protein